MANKMGRPQKLQDMRISTHLHITGRNIEAMTEYVNERKKECRDYSRSDFANEAFERYLAELDAPANIREGDGENQD